MASGYKQRVRCVDTYIRDLAKTNDETFNAARRGVIMAAEHLLEKVKGKIGTYQPTGGPPSGYGRWPKLKYETRLKKLRKYGVGDKPLLMKGENGLLGSFRVIKGGKGRLSASVGSDSEYLIHHVYGAPGANVPMRDPIRVTAMEERDTCHEIIENEIQKVINRW